MFVSARSCRVFALVSVYVGLLRVCVCVCFLRMCSIVMFRAFVPDLVCVCLFAKGDVYALYFLFASVRVCACCLYWRWLLVCVFAYLLTCVLIS